MEQDFFASLRVLRESPPPGDPPPETEIVIDRVCYIDAGWGKVFAVVEAGGLRYRLGEEELANLLERQLVGRRIVSFRKTRRRLLDHRAGGDGVGGSTRKGGRAMSKRTVVFGATFSN